jgi:hypothetical protein
MPSVVAFLREWVYEKDKLIFILTRNDLVASIMGRMG